MKPRAPTLPPRAALPGRHLARFFARNFGLCATFRPASNAAHALAAAGWEPSPSGPGLQRGHYILLPGVGTRDWRLLSTSHVLPSVADAGSALSDTFPALAIKSVRIIPLAIRAPLRLAAEVEVSSDRARTRCERRHVVVVGARNITLQVSSSVAGDNARVFADAFMCAMSTDDDRERRAIFPFDARNTPTTGTLASVARDLAQVMDHTCDFIDSVPEVEFDTSLKLKQRVFGDVYLTPAGARCFVLGLPTHDGMARFRVDATPGLVERHDEEAKQ